MRRGKKLYLRYIDTDGTERTRLARGATTLDEARPMLAEVELRAMYGKIEKQNPIRRHEDEQRLVAEYERWEKHVCPTCGHSRAPDVF